MPSITNGQLLKNLFLVFSFAAIDGFDRCSVGIRGHALRDHGNRTLRTSSGLFCRVDGVSIYHMFE